MQITNCLSKFPESKCHKKEFAPAILNSKNNLALKLSTKLQPFTSPTTLDPYLKLLIMPDTGGIIREIDLESKLCFEDVYRELLKAGVAHPQLIILPDTKGNTVRGIRLKNIVNNPTFRLSPSYNKRFCDLVMSQIIAKAKHQLLLIQELVRLNLWKSQGISRLNLLTKQVEAESSFRPHNVSVSGALGLHQMMPYSFLDLLDKGLLDESLYPPIIWFKLSKLGIFQEFIPIPDMTSEDIDAYLAAKVISRVNRILQFAFDFIPSDIDNPMYNGLKTIQKQNLLKAFHSNLRDPSGVKHTKFEALLNHLPVNKFPLITIFKYGDSGKKVRCQIIFENKAQMVKFFSKFSNLRQDTLEQSKHVINFIKEKIQDKASIYSTLVRTDINTHAGVTFLAIIKKWDLALYNGSGKKSKIYKEEIYDRVASLEAR